MLRRMGSVTLNSNCSFTRAGSEESSPEEGSRTDVTCGGLAFLATCCPRATTASAWPSGAGCLPTMSLSYWPPQAMT